RVAAAAAPPPDRELFGVPSERAPERARFSEPGAARERRRRKLAALGAASVAWSCYGFAMISARILASLLLATLLCACGSSPRARTAFAHRVGFEAVESFAMMHPNRPVPAAGGLAPFTLHRLRQMTFAVLKERGLKPAVYTEAQLRVAVV